jgi:long-chain acyl-CoA synthetase
LHHSDGCTHGALLTFICGATLVRPGSLSPASLIDSLGRVGPRGVSHWIVTPTILRYLSMVGEEAKSFLGAESFRFLISTGAYLPEPQWREFEERFGRMVVNVYGLTETVAESVYCGPSAETRRLGTIGKPIDAEAKIVDAEGRPVPPGTPGELCLKGRHIMKGYFRNPEETEKVLRDGWLFTGDIVSVDEDGFYRIVGRKKNIIIVAGLNVHPEDVTDVIRTMPGVADAVTFGLPDEVFGERVVSCVQRRRGTQLDPQDVRAFCMTMMVSYKLPRDIFIVDDMPRGPVGKVQIEEIKKAVLGSREDHHELPAGTTCSAVGVAANVPTWQGRPAGARAGARGRQGSGP